MTATIGHNSLNAAAPAGFQPFDHEDAILDGDIIFRYVQWNVNDYLAGTAKLTAEEEGVYMRFLMQLYSEGKPLNDDDVRVSKLLRLSIRVWRRVKASLVGFGKIVIRNSYLTNSRFEAERIKRAADHQKRADAAHKRWAKAKPKARTLPKDLPNVAPTLPEVLAQIPGKANENNDSRVKGHMLTIKPITNNQDSNSRVPDSVLAAKLEEAAGASLKNAAGAPGLLVLSEPRRWLEQGCDLELDILPTLRAVGAKRPPRSVSGWAYFTQAIADAKARRTAPMPAGTLPLFNANDEHDRKQAKLVGCSLEEYRQMVAQ